MLVYEPHLVGAGVWESVTVAGTWSWVNVRVAGVAVSPAGVQSIAVILKKRSIVLPFLASVAVMIASTVFACVRSDPNKTSFVPTIEANENEGLLFN